MITSFVFAMMLIIEYINILTRGEWQKKLTKRLWGQYPLAAGLGAVPGCLGAFAVVAMYTHGILGVGAVVAAMIATSGATALFIVSTAPDHFLDEHLWKHVVMKHVPRIFLWTAGTMVVLYFLTEHLELDFEKIVQQGK